MINKLTKENTMDTMQVQYRKQEGGYRLWVVSMNPDCKDCQEIKTAYKVNKSDCLRLASELADYYRNELGQRAEIKELCQESEDCNNCDIMDECINFSG
jgi:hypothetical protein